MERKLIPLVILFLLWGLSSETIAQSSILRHIQDAYLPSLDQEAAAYSNTPSDSILTLLGRWPWGRCSAVNTIGNLVYMGNGPTWHILNIANPSSPVIVGEYLTNGLVVDIKIKDDIAFLCTGKLLIFDINDPVNPAKISELINPSGWGFIQITVEDSLAFLIDLGGLLRAVDISDPRQPVLRGRIFPTGLDVPTTLAVKENFVYTGNAYWPMLTVVDATNPDSLTGTPRWIGGGAESALVRDSLLYLGVRGIGVEDFLGIYNIGVPAEPVEMGRVMISSPDSSLVHIRGITIEDQYAYVNTRFGIYSINIADPTNPFLVDSIMKPNPSFWDGHDIAYANGSVFSSNSSGMWTVDITQPDSLQNLNFFPTSHYATRIALRDNLAFVACGLSGLWILDIANPAMPGRVANLNTAGFAEDITVSDSFVYLVNYGFDTVEDTRGLYIIDISDVHNPQILSHYRGITKEAHYTTHPNSIAHSGKLVFMTSATYSVHSDSVLEIIDVSDPQQPERVGILRAPYLPYHISVKDSFAFLATPDSGLRIISWHNPEQPQDVSNILNIALGVAVNGSYTYVFNGDFSVIDISDPVMPFLVSSLNSSYGASSIDAIALNNFVYWAEEKLGVIDVSDPRNPRQISTFGYRSFSGVDAYKDLVAATNVNYGVWLFRNNALTAVTEEKVRIPDYFKLSPNFPNPFNAQTTIEYYSPKRARIAIEIFNILGEQVKSLFEGEVMPGVHRLFFDASNIPSGLYFYRLKAPGISLSHKMVIIR